MRCTDLGSGRADSGFGVSEVRWRWKGHVPEAQNFCQTSAPQAPKFFRIFCVAGVAIFLVFIASPAPIFFAGFFSIFGAAGAGFFCGFFSVVHCANS